MSDPVEAILAVECPVHDAPKGYGCAWAKGPLIDANLSFCASRIRAALAMPRGEACVRCIKCRSCVGACDCTGGPQTEQECTCYELTGGHQPGCYFNRKPPPGTPRACETCCRCCDAVCPDNLCIDCSDAGCEPNGTRPRHACTGGR